MPPGSLPRARVCLLTILSPSTRTPSFLKRTLRTLPVLLLSLPVITITVSPFFTCRFFPGIFYSPNILLKYLRSKGYDFHKLLGPKFSGNRSENTGSDGFFLVVDDYT